MKNFFLAGAAACLLFSCSEQNKKPAETADASTSVPKPASLRALYSNYWEQQSRFFPLEATGQGDNRFNNRLPNDQTHAFRDSLRTFYQTSLDQLHLFQRDSLAENDKISYDIFEYEMQTRLGGLKLNTWQMPFQQFWGLPLTMGQLGAGTGNQPFKTAQDYDNWLGRTKGFAVWADSAIANFRVGMRTGVVLPRPLVEKMIPQMQAFVVSDPTKSLFFAPVKQFPAGVSEVDQQRLVDSYKAAILTQLVPTYRKLADFLKNEYLPVSRTTTGISEIPDGADTYRYYVKYWTTTDKTPEEIYQTGRAEVSRIRGEMEDIKRKVGFKGDLAAFFEHLKTDKQFTPYQNSEQVLDAFRGIQARIEPNLKKMFGRTPKTPFEIRQTEAFRAESASAEYNQGSPDGARPGIFYIPILNAREFNITSGMESLFLHEAIPGHHYQISLQQENDSLPKFRRFAWYGAMGEGWALYTESLGKELGLYTDPYQRMGALGDEIHRAIRLVVDVGMHTKGMTREEAIQYMMENEAISEQGATAEIERYMAIPGQALSYKVGALKIQELRAKYQSLLGATQKLRARNRREQTSHFSLSAFHDELLKDGVMPLSVLERKMDAWAEDER
ncbi:DUF885 domain-containing protein [Hymenobacter defluvii]|uniref:DUF885 domain-containing protein n=1 Tax=Hymenobacter defluvii TaxID=2054411 RepID=A0ABS3TF87_9BACT|nr:DUF885 domain-containing protein [Hymenobacter defluvii]MBO3271843.1 DUF885 domain-containing protein [Hymenobacter defluvii]